MKPKIFILRLAVFSAVAVISIIAVASASGQNTQSANPLYNPNQIAIQRWYQANQSPAQFTVGGGTDGIVFDGVNLWVGSFESGMLTELSLNGNILATVKLAGNPIGLAYDGANIWVANYYGDSVQKINIANPSQAKTFKYADLKSPYQLVFDGTYIWVTGWGSNKVVQLKASDGTEVRSFATQIMHPAGVAFDGACVWVTDTGPANQTGDVEVFSAPETPQSPGCRLAGKTFDPGGVNPYGIVYDGTNMWVGEEGSNNVVVLDGINGTVLKTIRVGMYPRYLVFDGAYIWVANQDSCNMSKLMATNNPLGPPGTKVGDFPVGCEAEGLHHGPQNIAFDGASIWVTLGGDHVQKF